MKNYQRNTGIDMLRICSMCMIIILHIINKGVDYSLLNTAAVYNTYFIRAIVICSVNVYVLISAYFLQNNNTIKVQKILKTLIEVWVINIFVAGGLILSGTVEISSRADILFLIFPFFSRRNWFVNVYLLLYFFHPFLNKVIENISEKQLRLLSTALVLVFSVFPSIMPNRNWTYDTIGGYSICWFCCLYFVMASMKTYQKSKLVKNRVALVISYILCAAIVAASKILVIRISEVLSVPGIKVYSDIWYAYDAFPVLFMSVVLFYLFYGINWNLSIRKCNLIGALGSSTLGVYLIHDNYKMREVLWTEIVPVPLISVWKCAPFVYCLISIVVYVLCAFLYYLLNKVVKRYLKKFLDKLPSIYIC